MNPIFEHSTARLAVPVPDDLRREVMAARLLAVSVQESLRSGVAVENCEFAAEALISIYSCWKTELARLSKAVRDSLPPDQAAVLPLAGESPAGFVNETVILEFPLQHKPTIPTLDLLNTILDNAMDGKVNLMAGREPPAPDFPPRRWTNAWWRNLFRTAWLRCQGLCVGMTGRSAAQSARCGYCRGSGFENVGVSCRACSSTGRVCAPENKSQQTNT